MKNAIFFIIQTDKNLVFYLLILKDEVFYTELVKGLRPQKDPRPATFL